MNFDTELSVVQSFCVSMKMGIPAIHSSGDGYFPQLGKTSNSDY